MTFLFYSILYSRNAFEHKHCRKHKCSEVAFPTSTNVNNHDLSALDSDRTARDNVEISLVCVFPTLV